MAAPDLFELVLCTRDVEVAAAFYRDVVGLEPINEPSNGWAAFWAGDKNENRWLGLRNGYLLHEEHSPLPEGQRFGPAHFALKLPASELDRTLERLKAHEVPVFGPQKWAQGRFEGCSYYFYDPDANLVEFWFPKGGNAIE
jgi:catechol 2,3-dioxygenase-like lactoylglutathione lyase family enzyme